MKDYDFAQREIVDLQKQVTVLLKECRDVQLRCGLGDNDGDDSSIYADVGMETNAVADNVISERLLTFNDINGLVEQNVQLRGLVRSLSDQIENRESEFKEKLEMEHKKLTDEAAARVANVLQRAEEQGNMIENLRASFAMYKRLYEEQKKRQSPDTLLHSSEAALENGGKDLLFVLEGAQMQEASKMAQEKVAKQLGSLEEKLSKARSELVSLQLERDKLGSEAKHATEKLERFMKEFEHQDGRIKGLEARNLEHGRLILDFQKRLNESMHVQHASEDHCRKLNMEVSALKHEKEMLSNAEKRACDEVRRLSERVHRLQSSLDTFQSAEDVRKEARAAERRKQEEYVKQIEREWAEAKKELQLEKENVRSLTCDREQTLKNAMRQVDDMGKELADALRAVTAAKTRAAVAETKLDLEKKKASSDQNVADGLESRALTVSSAEITTDLIMMKEEVGKLREEAQANKEHMLQYKNIAQVNEDALKQMEAAHENFKIESEKLKESLEAELISSRVKISELHNELRLKSEEVVLASAGKEEALSSALAEINVLKEERSSKISQVVALEMQVSVLKEDLEKEHERWRSAQTNYERQVILQSETIQELTKTSQTLASLQEEASGWHKLADERECINNELKTKWEAAQSMLEESRRDSQKKYDELNEQNKLLHSRLEALHIQLAESDRSSVGMSSRSNADPNADGGLQNVVSYLRRSKEIAETEISLLRQEKLRLQSRLESALKAAENAKVSLGAERANSRAFIFSEEEMMSLQHQVEEMNLLRESNMQLREENKQSVEECQKMRELAQETETKADNMKILLRGREAEIEACKKEIEMSRAEKDFLQKRVSELLEKNINVEDYDKLKANLQRLQEKLKEKDDQLVDTKNCMSRQQETLSKLEEDLGRNEAELNSIKSELDKQNRTVTHYKRRNNSLSKERDELLKEKDAANKQIEELKQGKKVIGNAGGELAVKEKEEKDTRIQMLEKMLDKVRDDLRKEKENHDLEKAKHESSEKTVQESVKHVEQERSSFENKFEKHNEALRRLSDELAKLKHVEGSLPEGTSVVQILSGSILGDHAAVYLSAVENFEKIATSVLGELGQTPPVETPPALDAPAPVPTASQTTAQIPVTRAIPTNPIPAKAAEEKDKRFVVSRTNVGEVRKPGRRLVRPWRGKTEEPQVTDAEMSEVTADKSNLGGKPVAASQDTDANAMQGNLISSSSQPLSRKRPSQSVAEGSEQQIQGEALSQGAAPVLKKAKGQGSSEGGEAEVLPGTSAANVSLDAAGDVLTGGSNEEVIAAENEMADIVGDKMDSDVIGGSGDQVEVQNQKSDDAEDTTSDKPTSGTLVIEIDESLKDELMVEEDQQGDREEGELPSDVSEAEGGADVGSPESGEFMPEGGITPESSPLRMEEETAAPTEDLEAGEIPDDENDTADTSNIGSEKANDTDDQNAVVETDQGQETTPVAGDVSTTNASADADVVKAEAAEVVKQQVSPASQASTVVNLAARARERARMRQLGAAATSSLPAAAASPSALRGRVRGLVRGRGVGARVLPRGGGRTGGRGGQSSGQQG
ncbi:unnamed protein product [Linum tenue]|uniref:Nucleoprotein TPR/MLP1 domain-containing protein n=4 Tax=Linum tenue TaxID=586396 RepID=A0AAV0H0H9_9ROSI|nr:unnamed protein product [Linum tenue]